MQKKETSSDFKETKINEKLGTIIALPQFEKLQNKRLNAKEWTLKEEQRINGMLTELKESGRMSEELVYKLRSCGGVAPSIYGLAKVHKTGTPVRTVLSIAYYKVAKQVADWLEMIPEAQINCSSKSIVDQFQSL